MGHYSFAAAFIGGLLLSAGAVKAQDFPDIVRPAQERIVERFIIGGSADDDARRRVAPWELGDGGWPDFVQSQVPGPYRWGIRRFWLHNPFGMQSGEVMQFDQYLDAKEGRQDFLIDRFAESWRPIVKGSLGNPVELICYLGAMDPDDDRMKALYEEDDPAATLATLLKCIQPVLMAGASIGADAATRLDDDGPAFHFYKFLESIGMPVYIESRPRKNQPAWTAFPVFAIDQWWKRSNPEVYPDSGWAIPNGGLNEERLRMITDLGNETDRSSIQAMVQRIRAVLLQGDTVVVRSRLLRENGVSMNDLTQGIDSEIARRKALTTQGEPEKLSGPVAAPNPASAAKNESSITIRRSTGVKNRSKAPRRVFIGPGGSNPTEDRNNR